MWQEGIGYGVNILFNFIEYFFINAVTIYFDVDLFKIVTRSYDFDETLM